MLRYHVDILATSTATDGREFVAIAEFKKYPFFLTQYHIEKEQFENKIAYDFLNRTPEKIRLAFTMLMEFVEPLRELAIPRQDTPIEALQFERRYTHTAQGISHFSGLNCFRRFVLDTFRKHEKGYHLDPMREGYRQDM
jgi:hypothetical protein